MLVDLELLLPDREEEKSSTPSDILSQKSSNSDILSQKSSTHSAQKSSTDSDQEERKIRKLNSEEEAVKEEEYYDSSDDEQTEEDEGLYLLRRLAEEGDDDEDLAKEQLYTEFGDPISNEDILHWMSRDNRLTQLDRINLLPKVRRYIKSTSQSLGYDTTGYPGYIQGISTWIPEQNLINKRDRYPEGYNYLVYMCTFALDDYNERESTDYKVVYIEKVNSCATGMGHAYKMTFTACWRTEEKTFQASVWYNVVDILIHVYDIRIKASTASSSISPAAIEQGDEKCIGSSDMADPVDPVEVITDLSNIGKPRLLEIIRKDRILPKADEDVLLDKVRKYFDSIVTSQGFKCSYYPGHIPGLTNLKPRDKILHKMNSYPECNEHVRMMARFGLFHYLESEGSDSDIILGKVVSVNLWEESRRSHIYYITFKARNKDKWCDVMNKWCDVIHYRFEAKVWDRHGDLNVIFCRLVT